MAALACLVLVTCGLLQAHHAAAVPHVRERSGQIVHGAAASLQSPSAARDTWINVRGAALHEHRACAMASCLHSPAAPGAGTLTDISPRVSVSIERPRAVHGPSLLHLYRLAPKTSPPRA